MTPPDQPRSFTIIGKTTDGNRFRPSDWAERLCGVMSAYQPGSAVGRHLTYSPWVMPTQQDGVKCVKVDARLYAHEALAYRFLLNFAADNNLIVAELNSKPAEAVNSGPVVVNQAATDHSS